MQPKTSPGYFDFMNSFIQLGWPETKLQRFIRSALMILI